MPQPEYVPEPLRDRPQDIDLKAKVEAKWNEIDALVKEAGELVSTAVGKFAKGEGDREIRNVSLLISAQVTDIMLKIELAKKELHQLQVE